VGAQPGEKEEEKEENLLYQPERHSLSQEMGQQVKREPGNG
jgi:hypothetical protein